LPINWKFIRPNTINSGNTPPLPHVYHKNYMPKSRSQTSLTRKFIHTCNVHAVILAPGVTPAEGTAIALLVKSISNVLRTQVSFHIYSSLQLVPILGQVTEFHILTGLFTSHINMNKTVPPSPLTPF